MSRFSTEKISASTENFRIWEITHSLTYQSDDGSIYTIPVGFTTDFASVPRMFWSILPPIDKYAFAAVLHDYLIYHKTELFLTKEQIDNYFREALRSLGISPWKIFIMYHAVKKFGKY